MTVPLMVLAVGSVVAGYIGFAEVARAEHLRTLAGTGLRAVMPRLPLRRRLLTTARALEIGMAAVSVAIACDRILRRIHHLLQEERSRRARGGAVQRPVHGSPEQVVRG